MKFTSALQLILITLKLLDKIDWTWFWVLAPLWASFVAAMVVMIVVGALQLTFRR